MNSIERRLLDFLKNYLIGEKKKVLVAFSGGPDSTALLLALFRLQKLYPFSLEAAYVNHGMRTALETGPDDLFVTGLCSQHKIPLYSLFLPYGMIKSLSLSRSASSEEVARNLRYDFFSKIANDDTFIALGHTKDDQLETMITRFFQGTTISGLKGIPPQRGNLVRPLIHFTKRELISYLDRSTQIYRVDGTNQSCDYLRNRVRNLIIPEINKTFPSFDNSLIRLSSHLEEIDSMIESMASQISIHKEGDSSFIDLLHFQQAPNPVRQKILYRLFDKTYRGGEPSFRLKESFFTPLLKGDIKNQGTVLTGHGLRIHTMNNSLIFSQMDPPRNSFFHIFDGSEIKIGSMIFYRGEEGDLQIPVLEGSPLIIRSRIEGDQIEKGDFFQGIKKSLSQISPAKRDLVPIIEDRMGIAFVLARPLGGKNIERIRKNGGGEKYNILYLGVRIIN